jgi:hypothetical protein
MRHAEFNIQMTCHARRTCHTKRLSDVQNAHIHSIFPPCSLGL